jgi:hypothetical protein
MERATSMSRGVSGRASFREQVAMQCGEDVERRKNPPRYCAASSNTEHCA